MDSNSTLGSSNSDIAGEKSSQTTQDYPSSIDEQKKNDILEACNARDIDALVRLATSSGGLLEDDVRRVAWPILLGYDRDVEHAEQPQLDKLPRHGDEDQVKLDVNRAFVYYPNYASEKHLEDKKEELLDLITSILRRNPILCYFQGYHDISQVLLLVLGRKGAFPALEKISLFRIRDYMLPSLSPAIRHLQLLPAILKVADSELCDHISGAKPYFALAATLTLYAHDVQEYGDIARLYDFILAYEPVLSIYLFATIILSRRDELLDIPIDEPEMIHVTLSKLPQPLNLEAFISDTLRIYRDHPPASLPSGAWRRISSHSVLKTLLGPISQETREQAVEHFERQAQEIKREEMRQQAIVFLRKNSRSFGLTGAAILVGLLSYWLSRKGTDTNWTLLRYTGITDYFNIWR